MKAHEKLMGLWKIASENGGHVRLGAMDVGGKRVFRCQLVTYFTGGEVIQASATSEVEFKAISKCYGLAFDTLRQGELRALLQAGEYRKLIHRLTGE